MKSRSISSRRFAIATLGVLAPVLTISLFSGRTSVADDDPPPRGKGHVYTLSNAVEGNELVVFERTARGLLVPMGSVPTGGAGTGGGLHNQGALAVGSEGLLLFAVNPGDDTISTFSLKGPAPRLLQVIPSGGHLPISVAVREGLLYVLHSGGDKGGVDSINGFWITRNGLNPIPGSARPLSAPATGPAEAKFTPEGKVLIVTERGTNKIDTYTLNQDGTVNGPKVQTSHGPTPFGFSFTRGGKLLVAEAAGGAAGASSVSLYSVGGEGTLTIEAGSLHTQQTAACWVTTSEDDKYAYTSNTPAATLSGLIVDDRAGTLALVTPADGATASTGAGSAPTDGATFDGRVLYVLNSGLGQVIAFDIRRDGSLSPLDIGFGFPASGTGLVIR